MRVAFFMYALLVIQSACTEPQASRDRQTTLAPGSLLFNPGPYYRAGKTLIGDMSVWAHAAAYTGWGSTLEDAHLVGNPAGECPDGLAGFGPKVPVAANGACESYYSDTRVGWQAGDLNQNPDAGQGNGWSLLPLNGGGYRYFNQADGYW